jgi:hypothetical protein
VEPVPAALLVTLAALFYDEPELPALVYAELVSEAFSTTSILPPNWKLLFFTADLLFVVVLVSHEHDYAWSTSTF